MSLGLKRGREPDTDGFLLSGADLPPLPDDPVADPQGGRIDPRRWFDNADAHFELEIGSGKGTFLMGESAARPETNFIGIEWAREFAVHAADRARRCPLA